MRNTLGICLAGLGLSLALSVGCATPARVFVPPTPEGNACVRECMVVFNTCRSGGGGIYGGGYYGGPSYGAGISPSYGSGNCSFQHVDCLKTCPGAEVNTKASAEPVTNGGIRYSDTRLSLSYLASIPSRVGDDLRWPTTSHNLGIDVSSGQDVRFHVGAYYGNLNGVSLLRLEPAALGFPIALRRGPRFRFELEPVVSLIDAELLFPRQGNLLTLGSSVRLQLNFLIDRFYLAVAPLGLQARYFGFASGFNSSTTDFALDYRPQLFVGLTF